MERENKTTGSERRQKKRLWRSARDTSYDISLMYTKRHLNPGSTVMWVKRNHTGTGTVRFDDETKRGKKARRGKKNLTKAPASAP